MSETFNIYCDESCHLQHDQQKIMVLGAVSCPEEKAQESAVRIREIKVKYQLSPHFEIKWTKVSPAKVAFYKEVIDYFFDDDDLSFRAIVAQKTGLDHTAFKQDHDTWYYKMYFQLLEVLLGPKSRYQIYIDIKDTRSQEKVKKLHEVLCNSKYDFGPGSITPAPWSIRITTISCL